METILNPPVTLVELQKPLSAGFAPWQIGDALHDLLSLLPFFLDPPADLEHLGNPSPFPLKPCIHLRALTHF